MADERQDSIEPAFQCKPANKELALKNTIAAEKWQRVQSTLEKERKNFDKKINFDRNVLLKQRERLQFTTTTLINTAPETSKPRRMTLADVYDALLKAVKEDQKPSQGEDYKSVQSEPCRRRASTLSFDSKRVTRKPTYFSLQNLQRAQSSFHTKLQAIAQEQEQSTDDNDDTNCNTSAPKLGAFDLSQEEQLLGPKLRLPPTALPAIRNQSLFQPRARNFDKRRMRSCIDSSGADVDEVQYCRYLRGGRRSSAPVVRPGISLKYSTMSKRP